jgi:putative component of membrane protein insertase Oxa1/YidC/SpoIIIJ protein YidD
MTIVKRLAIAFLHVARLQLGFWEAPVCLFEETCTRFSHRQLQERALPIAIIIIAWRVIRCNPITGIWRRFRKN